MAFKIAEAFVELSAKTGPLVSGLGKAKGLLASFGSGIGGALAPLAALAAGTFAVGHAISTFAEGEMGIQKLRASIAASGQDVEATSAKFEAFAATLQNQTRTDDDASRALLQYGTALGLSDDNAMKATQAAVGLETALGIGAKDAVKALSKELAGQKSTLDRQIPALKGVTDTTERLAIISKAASDGFKTEEAATGTLAGTWDQLKDSLGDLSEAFGGLIAGGGAGAGILGWIRGLVIQLTTGIEMITRWKESMISAFTESANTSGTWLSAIVGTFSAVKNALVTAGKFLFFTVSNFELSWAVMKESALNAFNYVVARVSNFATNIGKTVTFFSENWSDIWASIIDLTMIRIKNLGENIKRMFTAVVDNIKSVWNGEGFKGLPEMIDLNTGFKTQVKNKLQLEEFIPPKAADKAAQTFADAWVEYTKPQTGEVAEKLSNEIALGTTKTIAADSGKIAEAIVNNKKGNGINNKIFDKATAGGKSAGGAFGSVEDVFRNVQSAALSKEEKTRKEQVDIAKKSHQELRRLADFVTSGWGIPAIAI